MSLISPMNYFYTKNQLFRFSLIRSRLWLLIIYDHGLNYKNQGPYLYSLELGMDGGFIL
jgi:hypothetical protein